MRIFLLPRSPPADDPVVTERRVRIDAAAFPPGVARQGTIALDDGRTVPEAEARWLAPAHPGRSSPCTSPRSAGSSSTRGADPGGALLLPQAAEHAERPPRRDAPPARHALPQLRGRAAVVIVGADARRRGRRARARLRLRARQRRRPARLPPRRPRARCCASRARTASCRSARRCVTADEWSPDDGYTLRTMLNGELVQEGDADDIIWDYRYQLADLCRLITLEPGDVVLTGTPANSRPMEPGRRRRGRDQRPRPPDQPGGRLGRRLAGPGEQPAVSPNTLHVALAIPEDEAERIAAEGRPKLSSPPRARAPTRGLGATRAAVLGGSSPSAASSLEVQRTDLPAIPEPDLERSPVRRLSRVRSTAQRTLTWLQLRPQSLS